MASFLSRFLNSCAPRYPGRHESSILATHLGVVPSTLSAAITRLTKLGYLECKPIAKDRRRKELKLTALGAQAMASTSVLDAQRVRAMLALLNPDEPGEALRGLALLARAARRLNETK